MKDIFREYLFGKGILVNTTRKDKANAFPALFALAHKLGIKITSGHELANTEIFRFASDAIGVYVPEPFYRGFPATVKKLTTQELLFDQLLHYFNTYYLGNFDEPGRSKFEEDFERIAFREYFTKKEFEIVDISTAESMLKGIAEDLTKSTRPLSELQYNLLKEFICEYSFMPSRIASKDTVIKLIIDTEDMAFAKQLSLSDVIKITDRICYLREYNHDLKKLNLKNNERKFISKVLDYIFKDGYVNIRECFERRRIWVGLLHHIHYKPKCAAAEEFLKAMRGGKNNSVYSEFENAIANGDIMRAADIIHTGKGPVALLRNLNYLLSRAKNGREIEYVISKIDAKNALTLIQLLISYSKYKKDEARTFKFVKFGTLKHHTETDDEMESRSSELDDELVSRIRKIIKAKLEGYLAGKLGKVYIDPEMKKIALPIQESTSMGGYGCLPRGSKISIPKTKKIRAFTYWEKVDDVDLSLIGIDDEGNETEFSWRTMFDEGGCNGITFSGDQTSGYDGGSEFYDIELSLFKKKHSAIKYLICTNNVFSRLMFSEFTCTAGYMTRDLEDSGEVFEPKTVRSSFKITSNSTTAYLFAIDITANEFIWLNVADESKRQIAATESIGFLKEYFALTDIVNMSDFFSMMASTIVDTPEDADVIISDKENDKIDGKEIVRSCDFEKIIALLNT